MARNIKPKYIAEGFEEDVTKLLNEFVEECSVDFSDFVKVWKKNHFSLVYMGRPDRIETCEFTNEVFRISSHFLPSPSFYRRVGAVYLLYSLYRNQIADPPVKIRIEIDQWLIIKSMQEDAALQQYRTLHYVIDYLIENAFLYVAHHTLKGPLTGSMQKISKNLDLMSSLKTTYRADLAEYSAQNNLQALKELHTQYLELKENLKNEVRVVLSPDNEVYDSFISDLDKLMNPQKGKRKEDSENIGARRAKIKSESFQTKGKNRFSRAVPEPVNEVVEEEEEEEEEPDFSSKDVGKKKRSTKNKRVPKHERRVGRPSKKPKIEVEVTEKSDDDNIDISHLITQQNDFFLPPEDDCKKLKCKPGRYYYKLSPKRDECEASDPDND